MMSQSTSCFLDARNTDNTANPILCVYSSIVSYVTCYMVFATTSWALYPPRNSEIKVKFNKDPLNMWQWSLKIADGGGYILRCLLITPGCHQDTSKIKQRTRRRKTKPFESTPDPSSSCVSWCFLDEHGWKSWFGGRVSLVAKVRHPNSQSCWCLILHRLVLSPNLRNFGFVHHHKLPEFQQDFDLISTREEFSKILEKNYRKILLLVSSRWNILYYHVPRITHKKCVSICVNMCPISPHGQRQKWREVSVAERPRHHATGRCNMAWTYSKHTGSWLAYLCLIWDVNLCI